MSLQAPILDTKFTYFFKTLDALSITSKAEAMRYGISHDENDNVTFFTRSLLTNDFVRVEKGSLSSTRKDVLLEPIFDYKKATRYSPQFLKDNPGVSKYKKSAGRNLKNFMPLLCDAYQRYLKGDTDALKGQTVYLFEGEKKAIAGDKNGFFSVSVGGILSMNFCSELQNLTDAGCNFVTSYDGDFYDISSKMKIDSDELIVNSRRVENFLLSASKFASQFFNYTNENGLKNTLYFNAINRNESAKGFDDLIEKYRTDKEVFSDVLSAFKSFRNSKYFEYKKLFRTSQSSQLEKYLCLDNHVNFYNRFKSHIKNNTFIFRSVKYKKIDDNFVLIRRYTIENDTITLDVKKYVSECQNELIKAIQDNKFLAIDAETGTGKTYALLQIIKYLNALTGQKFIITVPYQILAESIYNNAKRQGITNISLLCENHNDRNTIDKDLIVCTFDKSVQIADFENRVCIVDEAHNLVNAYNYRAKAIKPFSFLFERSKRVILLSGTHNELLLNVFKFHKISINSEFKQIVNTTIVETKNYNEELLKTLDYSSRKNLNQLDIVLFNNIEQLEEIKQNYIKLYGFNDEEIAIINSNKKDSDTYKSIIEENIIPSSVRLVLTTCLFAEGISIYNENISKILVIGTAQSRITSDLIKQFSARFRKMESVDLTCILPTERILCKSFLSCQISRFNTLFDNANKEIERLERDTYERAIYENIKIDDYSNSYDFDFVNHVDNSNLINHIIEKSCNSFIVDKFSILSEIAQFQNEKINNVALVSELLEYDNIKPAGHEKQSFDSDELKQFQSIAKATHDTKQLEKSNFVEQAKDLLLNDEFSSIYIESVYYQKKDTNKNLSKFIKEKYLTNNISIQSFDSLQFASENEKLIQSNAANDLIKDFISLKSLNVESDVLSDLICAYDKAFVKRFKARVKCFEAVRKYNDKKDRETLSNIEKSEIKRRFDLIISIERFLKYNNAKNRVITSKSIININRCYFDKSKETNYTTKQLKKELDIFYNFNEKKINKGVVIFSDFLPVSSKEYIFEKKDKKKITR